MSIVIEPPRTAKPKRTNWEKWGWIYMRVSGVALMILVFGHLFANLWVGEGIKAINFAFVAGKWSDPFWHCLLYTSDAADE
jgi:succinate dehydrogenase / fumarate reductase membrane anchor subunit